MITFSGMPLIRSLALAGLAACLSARPSSAKSPEEFVGPAPSADTAKPAPASPKTAPAAPSKAASAQPAPARAASKGGTAGRAAKPALDTARIHALYLDGDFDQSIHLLESALKGRKPLTHADSVFAFKHLGVMYAATPATREKGRYYMLQLISIEPTAKILDMYASDMIYLIFRNVQEEYENKHGRLAVAPAVDTAPAPPPPPKDTAPAPAPVPAARPAPKRDRTLYWVAGGAAVAAGAMGLVFILLDEPQPKKHNVVLNE